VTAWPLVAETVTADDIRAAFADAAASLGSLPSDASPLRRWSALAALAERDLDLARLTEAHLDATTILAELGGAEFAGAELGGAASGGAASASGQRWAVWAAEPPDGEVLARPGVGGRWVLHGLKRWCSGAHLCSHALITAHAPDGRRLFAVDVRQAGVRPRVGGWAGLGMARSGTESVELDQAVATAVGEPMAYLDRPGFWHGAIGVAACWYGGTVGLVGPLWESDRLDSHGLAHLGAVDTALAGARTLLVGAAAEIAAAVADEPIDTARRRALRVRAAVEAAAATAMDRVGRALGPGPLATDAAHSQRLADLTVYVRQSHAERDLAELGRLTRRADAAL